MVNSDALSMMLFIYLVVPFTIWLLFVIASCQSIYEDFKELGDEVKINEDEQEQIEDDHEE